MNFGAPTIPSVANTATMVMTTNNSTKVNPR
jgi:hypothetical protein